MRALLRLFANHEQNLKIGISAFVLGIVVGWIWHALEVRNQNAANANMVHFEESLDLGQPKERVRSAFENGNYVRLKLHAAGDCWSVTTAFQWDQESWLLLLGFRDSKLEVIAYRTEDGLNSRPPGIKADRIQRGAVPSCPVGNLRDPHQG